MSQPHPPIPEPQPHPQGPDDDGPRTQSILLPPSQRPTAAPGPDDPPTQVAQDWTPPADPAPPAGSHATEQLRGHGTGPLDLVPGFPDRPPVTASGSSTATLPPPSAGPGTTPGTPGAAHAAGASSHRRSPLAAVTAPAAAGRSCSRWGWPSSPSCCWSWGWRSTSRARRCGSSCRPGPRSRPSGRWSSSWRRSAR
ncbi:protein of unknown function [Modestobacter italicus]|uniref:Uncharacterized protein n=1 Tax=Modestobacter italicus (strain DSM 44449 / CECT 9708 / BC 501) TaxID=2732864 RepID=I4EQ77_MODI5|nr:protein of unknown function [Modestobacter marinus]